MSTISSNAPRRPIWPTVLGIISIIMAVLALAATSLFLYNSIERLEWYCGSEWSVQYKPVAHAIAMALDALLVVAAIVLIRRRSISLHLNLIYGIGMLIYVLGGTLATTWMAVDEQPSASVLIITALVGSAYPFFVTAWFLREPIRRQVASWKATASA